MQEVQIIEPRRFSVNLIAEGHIAICDGIEFADCLWLVPEWDDFEEDGFTRPSRMIRFDNHQHQRSSPGQLVEYTVNGSLPQGLLLGTPNERYQMLVGDEIPFVIPISSRPLN